VCAGALLLGAVAWARTRGSPRACAELATALAVGALLLALRLHTPQPGAAEQPVVLTLLEAPQRAGPVCRARVHVHGARPGRALLQLPVEHCALLPGARLVAALRFEPLRPVANPGGADLRRRAARRGIQVRARIAQGGALAVEPAPAGPWAQIERARRRIGDVLDPPGAGQPSGPLLRALVVGERSQLAAPVLVAFRDSGTSHLLAVSGMNVVWVFALVQGCVGLLLRCVPGGVAARAAGPLARALALAAALLYAAVAGLGVPALRAALMAAAGSLAVFGGRPGAVWNALALAGLCVLAVDPASLFEASLALSFAAVAGILLWAPPRGWLVGVHVTLAASFATAPLLGALGLPLPWLALPANALACPWFGAVVGPLAFASGVLGALWPTLGAALLPLAAWTAELGVQGLAAFASPDLLQLAPGRSAELGAALGASGFALRLARCERPWSAGLAGLLAAAALARMLVPLPVPAGESLLVLDVGHGDALLLRSGARAWLVDAGPRLGDFDAGERIVVPVLRAEGVSRLDVLAITHADLDHIGGAAAVLRALEVGELWLTRAARADPASRALLELARRRGVPLREVAAGERAQLGALRIDVLAPPPGRAAGRRNDDSLVLRVEGAAPGACALLAGDLPGALEDQLAAALRPCALLKLSHHGSASSSGARWLARLDPWIALASAGRRARSPVPAPGVRVRLRDISATLWETPRHGALRVRFTPSGPVVTPFLSEPWPPAPP